MKRSLIIFLSTAFALFLATLLIIRIVSVNVPREYRSLYSSLKSSLDDYEKYLSSKNISETRRVLFGAELLPANANRGLDLLKPSAVEGVKIYLDRLNKRARARQQFLAVLAKSARANGVEYFSPFWSIYFFTYVDYTWNTARLPYSELSERVNREAVEKIIAGEFSTTGEFYKELIKLWGTVD